MIILINGATHTGKTVLAQKLLETYHYPYLSIDHLKMGLIRSHQTSLTPESSIKELTDYLWPILKEIIKTNIENNQNLIIEGCYIPFDFKKDFSEDYLSNIRFISLIFTKDYINHHLDKIINFENQVEQRGEIENRQAFKKTILKENSDNLKACQQNNCQYILIDESYNISLDMIEKFFL